MIIGPPPRTDVDILLRDGWRRPFEDSDSVHAMLVATVPAALIAGAALYLGWRYLTPTDFRVWDMSLLNGVLLLFATIVVHELIHLASYPRGCEDSARGVGFWPERLAAYAYFQGTMTRNRRVACGLMPLMVLSLLPLAAAIVLGLDAPSMAFVSFWNAMGSGIDVTRAARVIRLVPRDSLVRLDGSGLWTKNLATSGA